MKLKNLLTPLLLLVITLSNAQHIPVNYRLTMTAGYNGPDQVPFWMRSNQFGSVPPAGGSIGLIGSATKSYNSESVKKFDWGVGAEGRLNIGNPTKLLLTEGYGKFRYGIFELKIGRDKEITGLCDTLLSSGSWSISGNALGVPKIQLSIPEFVSLPFFGRLFSIKGSYTNGILGNWYVRGQEVPNTNAYLIQHTLYGQLGKPGWKFKIFGGFNHQVVWGDEKDILGEQYLLNSLETFVYANLAKSYSHDTIRNTRIGNHMGSIDAGFTYEFTKAKLFVYHQFFYDAGALYYLANLRDGLSGISVTNKTDKQSGFRWNRFLLEFLYTKNQAGETWSPTTTSLYENYYNNGYYKLGWSHKNTGLGSPFISRYGTIKENLPETFENFTNNRLWVLHGGFDITFKEVTFTGKLSYSHNYGTYRTSKDGKLFNGENTEQRYGIFPEVNQFSGYISAIKNVKKIQIGINLAFDRGDLYTNSEGVIFTCGIAI